MTTKEMTAEQHTQTARDFLAASDREFIAGDHLQGSEKLYGAATQAVIAICQQRGWRYLSHRAMKNAVTDLAREYDDQFISAGFIAAERFHENFFPRPPGRLRSGSGPPGRTPIRRPSADAAGQRRRQRRVSVEHP